MTSNLGTKRGFVPAPSKREILRSKSKLSYVTFQDSIPTSEKQNPPALQGPAD